MNVQHYILRCIFHRFFFLKISFAVRSKGDGDDIANSFPQKYFYLWEKRFVGISVQDSSWLELVLINLYHKIKEMLKDLISLIQHIFELITMFKSKLRFDIRDEYFLLEDLFWLAPSFSSAVVVPDEGTDFWSAVWKVHLIINKKIKKILPDFGINYQYQFIFVFSWRVVYIIWIYLIIICIEYSKLYNLLSTFFMFFQNEINAYN